MVLVGASVHSLASSP